MNEPKLTKESLAIHGVCSFLTYQGVKQVCMAYGNIGYGIPIHGLVSKSIMATALMMSTPTFISLGCLCLAIPFVLEMMSKPPRRAKANDYTDGKDEVGQSGVLESELLPAR